MKWRRSEVLIIAVGLVVLVVVGIVRATPRGAPPTPYSSTSSAPDGTLALYRWLGDLGYHPLRLTAGPLQPAGLRALFVLEPQISYSDAEASAIRRWVREGGTLVLLVANGDTTLPAALGLGVDALPDPATIGVFARGATQGPPIPAQPLLNHPPLHALSTSPTAYIHSDSPGMITVLANSVSRGATKGRPAAVESDPAHPILLYERLGRGQVFAGTSPGVLTNGSIAQGDNRRLTLNVLAGLPPGATVGFDEYHLVVAPTAPASAGPATLGDALTGTDWGRALLYALALAAAYIALTGRRLGRPLRALPERGRSLTEYVVSMAAIFRRADLRPPVLGLWQNDLRQSLAGREGRRGRTDAQLAAEAGQRAGFTPQEQDELLALLQPPRRDLSENALVATCRRIAAFQERLRQ